MICVNLKSYGKMSDVGYLEEVQDDDFTLVDDDFCIYDADDTVCDKDDGLTEEEEQAFANECSAFAKLQAEIRRLYINNYTRYARPIKYQE